MNNVYNDQLAIVKLEQAIQDLQELQGDATPQRDKLIHFLRNAVEECQGYSRSYEQRLTERFSVPKEQYA